MTEPSTVSVQGKDYLVHGLLLVVSPDVAQPEIPGWVATWIDPRPDGTRVFGYSVPDKLLPGTPDPRD